MDESDKLELQALVVGFLQQGLKERPQGFTLHEFERMFPEKCDEPHDWYKRYQKKNTLEALECIQESIILHHDRRYNATYIKLNLNSDKVDPHLVDLITHQRPSGKRKGNVHSQRHRALASYRLNTRRDPRYESSSYRHQQPARINHDQQYRGESFIKRQSPPPASITSISANSTRSRAPVSPLSELSSWSNSKTHSQLSAATQRKSSSSVSSQRQPVAQQKEKTPEKEDDPSMLAKKSYLRQRIVSLLTRKFSQIKVFHLNALYEVEFDESINPEEYGHPNLTKLLTDPILGEHIKFNYTLPFVTISLRDRREHVEEVVKENIKSKLDAVDPFNVKPMLDNLEPIGAIKEPVLNNLEIEDVVKYRTLRLIFKKDDNTLSLDDWEHEFEMENRLKIRIREYGCRTTLEFFKKLTLDIPIKLRLMKNNHWVASVDIDRLSTWLQERMQKGHYRALYALESRYELVAFPDDRFSFSNPEEFQNLEFQPAHILSVRSSSSFQAPRANLNSPKETDDIFQSLWIQVRTPKRIEDQLCVEAFMTCYEDFKKKCILATPKCFIKPGLPCAVYDGSQQRWCRALVLKSENRVDHLQVTALLVDYGLVRNYKHHELTCLMKTHLKVPVGPIFCKLHGIKDEKTFKAQRWANTILQEYTNPPVTLACRFVGIVESKHPQYLPTTCGLISLVDTRQGKDCDLAKDINIPRDTGSCNGSPPDEDMEEQ